MADKSELCFLDAPQEKHADVIIRWRSSLRAAELEMQPDLAKIEEGILNMVLISTVGAVVQPAMVLFHIGRLVLEMMGANIYPKLNVLHTIGDLERLYLQ